MTIKRLCYWHNKIFTIEAHAFADSNYPLFHRCRAINKRIEQRIEEG